MIRPLILSDIDEVLAIETQNFSDPWTKNMFLSLIKNPSTKTFVIEENQEILGYMSIIDTKYVCEVLNIAVKEGHKRKGLASLLLNSAKKAAKSNGADKIFLEVRASNTAAINLYTKQGFKKDGIRSGYYGDEDAILMSFNCEDTI